MGIAREDLQIFDDAVARAKRSKHMLFPNGRVDAMSLLAYGMADVLVLGRGECRIAQRRGWAIVSSDVDWLVHPSLAIDRLFTRIVAAPEHGANSLRAELVVNAFASDLAIWDPKGLRVIRGKRPPRGVVVSWRGCRRALAFRIAQVA
jgi:hypothetical protein